VARICFSKVAAKKPLLNNIFPARGDLKNAATDSPKPQRTQCLTDHWPIITRVHEAEA